MDKRTDPAAETPGLDRRRLFTIAGGAALAVGAGGLLAACGGATARPSASASASSPSPSPSPDLGSSSSSSLSSLGSSPVGLPAPPTATHGTSTSAGTRGAVRQGGSTGLGSVTG